MAFKKVTHPMSSGGGVEGVGADLDVRAEDDGDDVEELPVRCLLREPEKNKRKNGLQGMIN